MKKNAELYRRQSILNETRGSVDKVNQVKYTALLKKLEIKVPKDLVYIGR